MGVDKWAGEKALNVRQSYFSSALRVHDADTYK